MPKQQKNGAAAEEWLEIANVQCRCWGVGGGGSWTRNPSTHYTAVAVWYLCCVVYGLSLSIIYWCMYYTKYEVRGISYHILRRTRYLVPGIIHELLKSTAVPTTTLVAWFAHPVVWYSYIRVCMTIWYDMIWYFVPNPAPRFFSLSLCCRASLLPFSFFFRYSSKTEYRSRTWRWRI